MKLLDRLVLLSIIHANSSVPNFFQKPKFSASSFLLPLTNNTFHSQLRCTNVDMHLTCSLLTAVIPNIVVSEVGMPVWRACISKSHICPLIGRQRADPRPKPAHFHAPWLWFKWSTAHSNGHRLWMEWTGYSFMSTGSDTAVQQPITQMLMHNPRWAHVFVHLHILHHIVSHCVKPCWKQ